MRFLLAKMTSQKAVGLYVGDHEVTVSRVASTLFGPVEMDRKRETYESPDQLPEVLSRLLAGLGARPPIALGLAPERVFYSTRPIRTDDNTASPEILLHEALQSTGVIPEDMVVDVVKSRPEQRKVASIAACRKNYLHPLIGAIQQLGQRLVRVEPGPCALLRAAVAHCPAPRRGNTILRVIIGKRKGLAVAVSAHLPLVWRTFDLPDETSEDSDAFAIVNSTLRSLQTVILHCGVEATINVVLIHGRPDLHARLQEGLAAGLNVQVQAVNEPELDNGSVAYGLALGGLRTIGGLSPRLGDGFDLARSFRTREHIRDIIPWRDLICQVTLLAAWAAFLMFRAQTLERDFRVIEANAHSSPAGLGKESEAQLRKEKQDLSRKVEAVRDFLGTRALWNAHTQEIASRLPKGATLISLKGNYEFEDRKSKKESAGKVKKALILRATAPLPEGSSVPREIDDFLTSLRSAPHLQRDFPLVELADIRWSQNSRGGVSLATFTVVCLSRTVRTVSGKPPNVTKR